MEPAGFSLREPERTSPTEVSSGVSPRNRSGQARPPRLARADRLRRGCGGPAEASREGGGLRVPTRRVVNRGACRAESRSEDSPWFYSSLWWYPPYDHPYYWGAAGANVRIEVQPKSADVYVDRYLAGIVDQFVIAVEIRKGEVAVVNVSLSKS